jgi:BNR repeat-containing family member
MLKVHFLTHIKFPPILQRRVIRICSCTRTGGGEAKLFLAIAFSFALLPAFSQGSEIGKGWAKTSINTVVFRKNAVVSFDDIQYAAYYDSTSHVVLARRNQGSDQWEVKQTDLKGNTADAHNTISIMVDGEGYLHVAWDHHNRRLNYCRSISPGSLELTGRLSMTGTDESDVTYPEFFRLPSGDLIFMYRSGMSGKGNLVMNRYGIRTKTWERVQNILVDGEGERNAYWQACVDTQGTIHLSWVWRETPDVATNHDLCYARSRDGGKSWEKSDGEIYRLPITKDNAEYAYRIPQGSELINQTSMFADDQGRPYIVTYWAGGNGIPQYRIVYFKAGQWQMQVVGHRETDFSLSGGGTKKIPISRPQLIIREQGSKISALMIFRDAERGSRVSLATSDDLLNSPSWMLKDITKDSVGDWEPSYDTELWKERSRLNIFVQRTAQGDGERMAELNAQPVYILEYSWK